MASEAANGSTTRLILDDNGNPGLGKIQLLAWTFVGVGIYLALVRTAPPHEAGGHHHQRWKW